MILNIITYGCWIRAQVQIKLELKSAAKNARESWGQLINHGHVSF